MGKQLNKKRSQIKQRENLIDELLLKCTKFNSNINETIDNLFTEYKELNTIIEKLKQLESEICLCLPDRDLNVNKFINWCQVNKIDINNLEIFSLKTMKNEYGIKAKCLINENDTLLNIPRKLMITSETAIDDAAFGKFAEDDKILQTMPNVLLALHLMEEYCRKESSFWQPYLNILPSEYCTPLYFNLDEMNFLKLSQATFIDAIHLCRNIFRQYAYFYKKLKQTSVKLALKDHYTYELFRWAISTVMTRQNLIPSSDKLSDSKMITALIPLWDLFNHSHGKISTDYDVEKDAAVCYAMRNFNKDEEIKIFYGQRANYELLLHNGFVYENNLYDHMRIKLGISKNDKLFHLRKQACERASLPICAYFKLNPKSSDFNKDLLAFLRIFHMNQDELEVYLNNENKYLEIFNETNQRFENIDKNIFIYLSKRCDLLLKVHKVTINESMINDNLNAREFIINSISTLLNSEKAILNAHLKES